MIARKRLAAFRDAVRGEIEGVADDVRSQAAMRIRQDPRILERWMGYCGASEESAIDYGNPCVYIEFMAADPSMLNLAVTDPEAFMRETGCDREAFMAYYDQSAERP